MKLLIRLKQSLFIFIISQLLIWKIVYSTEKIFTTESRSLPPKHFISNAVWISMGIGTGKWYDKQIRYDRNCILLDISGHFRKNWLAFSGGKQTVSPWNPHELRSYYFLSGKSFYQKYYETIFSVGININQYYHNTESEYGIIKSNKFIGAHFEAELLPHFCHVFGLGFKITANLNQKYSYIILSINPSFGSWAL